MNFMRFLPAMREKEEKLAFNYASELNKKRERETARGGNAK
jgi:hypothetical protein